MLNNDILRRIRYTFEMNDKTVMATFKEGGLEVTREQMSKWLKRDDDPQFETCEDVEFAAFLNGFIIRKRGKQDDQIPEPEARLNNNMIMRKLKIALNLKDTDLLELLNASQFPLSKHELSAFFRKSDHKNYKKCQDQVMRNFLRGMQAKFRIEPSPDTKTGTKSKSKPESRANPENGKYNKSNADQTKTDNRPKYSKSAPSKKTVYVNPNAAPKPPGREKLSLNKSSKANSSTQIENKEQEIKDKDLEKTKSVAADIWKASLNKTEE